MKIDEKNEEESVNPEDLQKLLEKADPEMLKKIKDMLK